MTARDFLAGAIREARAMTLVAFEGLSADDALRIPPNARNHVLWHLGHVLWMGNVLLLTSTGNPRPLPETWGALFAPGTEASREPSRYPSLEELRMQLEADRDAAIAAVARFDDAKWGAPPLPPAARFFRTVEGAVRHAVLHEGYHAGEISLLRRLMALSPTSEPYTMVAADRV